MLKFISNIFKRSKIIRPYDLWVGQFSQTNTNAPVLLKVITNTFRGNPIVINNVLTRTNTGKYDFTSQAFKSSDIVEISCTILTGTLTTLASPKATISFRDNTYTQGSISSYDYNIAGYIDIDGIFTVTIKKYYK